MSERDRRLAAKYAAKGKKSATETKREKEAGRNRVTEPVSGGILEALRNFDPSRPNETEVPRSEDSKSRARTFKSRLPRLG